MIRRFASQIIRGDRPMFAMVQSVGVQATILMINFCTGVLTARFLGPEGRGVYAAIVAWPQFLALLAIAGLGKSTIFYLRNSAAKPQIFGAGSIVLICTTIGLVGIGMLVVPAILHQYPTDIVFLAQVCLAGAFVNAFQMYNKSLFAGMGAYRLFNLSAIMPHLCYLVGLVVVVTTTDLSPALAAACLILGGMFALLAFVPATLKLVRPSLSDFRNQSASLTHYAIRAAASDVVSAAAGNADRLILIPFVPPAELGLYAVAFSFSRAILIVKPAIASVFFCSMSARSPEDIKVLHDRALRFMLPILGLVCGAIFGLGHFLLGTVYGAEFAGSLNLFYILGIEAVLSCLAQLTSLLYLSMNRPGLNSLIQVASFVTSVTCALILVPRLGASGAATALLIGSALRWTLLIGAIRVKLGMELPRILLTRADIHFLRRKLGL